MDVRVESAVFNPAIEAMQASVAHAEQADENERGAETPCIGDHPAGSSQTQTPQAEPTAEKNPWSGWTWLGLCKSPSHKIPNIVHVDVDAFFASVEQVLNPRLRGKPGLLVKVVEKNDAPPMFQTAFEVDGSQAGNVDFTTGTRFTFMDVTSFRSEWRTDLLLGNTYGIQTELYQPLWKDSRWFFAPHADASDTTFQIYQKNDPLADCRIYRIDIGGDVGYGFGRFSELRVGYEVGSLNTKLRLGKAQIPAVEGSVWRARLHYLLDITDDPVIPRRGVSVESNFHWTDHSPGTSQSFPAMDLKLGYFQPIARPVSLFAEGQGGSTFGAASTGIPQFFLGGPLRLSAYGNNEFQGNQFYLLRAGFIHDLLTLPSFVGKKVYAVGSYEIGKMYGVATGSNLPNDVAAGFLAETAVGPFFIGGSVGDSGHRKWFFQLGRVF